MSTKSLPDAVPEPQHSHFSHDPGSIPVACEPLLDRFCKRRAGWFVRHGPSEYAGPFADKADAQMALLYYSARLFWPDEKQLREFARRGK